MNKLIKLLPAAILGTVISYFLINEFVISISIAQYLVIEVIVTVFHALYNGLKVQIS
jgi:hypothetical protein